MNNNNFRPWISLFALRRFILAGICLGFALFLTQCNISRTYTDYLDLLKAEIERKNTNPANSANINTNGNTIISNTNKTANANISTNNNVDLNNANVNIQSTEEQQRLNDVNQVSSNKMIILWFYGLQLGVWTVIVGLLIWGAITLVRDE